MRHPGSTALLLAFGMAGASACLPEPDPGRGDSGQAIRGTEYLLWDQPAADSAELITFRYAFYVDGVRSEAEAAQCAPSAAAEAFTCSARLPAMAPGPHTIQLATFVVRGGVVIESERSAPLRVNVTGLQGVAHGIGASAPPGGTPGGASADAASVPLTFVASDGTRLRLDILLRHAQDATALAVTPDGRLLLAERAGRLHTISTGGSDAAQTLSLDDVSAPGGLLSIALHPDFHVTRFLFALYTVEGRDGEPLFRVARFREAGGVFGERAVLLDGIPASPDEPSGAIGFGPDGALYVGLDEGGDPENPLRPGSYNGKILRVDGDGTLATNAAGSPAFTSAGHHAPGGFDWQVPSAALWVMESMPDGRGRLIAVPDPATLEQPEPAIGYQLPAGTHPAGLIFYRGALLPEFLGDLLVASADGLLRVRFDEHDPLHAIASERLLRGIGEPFRAITVGPEGGIYLCTPTTVYYLRRDSRP